MSVCFLCFPWGLGKHLPSRRPLYLRASDDMGAPLAGRATAMC